MTVNYTVKRSKKRRRTISLQVNNSEGITIFAPYFTPQSEINDFVNSKIEWIKKVIEKQKQLNRESCGKKYEAGEEFLYLGIGYPLEVIEAQDLSPRVAFSGRRFYINFLDNEKEGEKLFALWYKAKAKEYLGGRVDYFSRILGIKYRAVKINSARTRWGSCSAENSLSFSFRLIMAPPEVVDYVVVHELMHVREKSHSQKYWKLVESVIPDYKKQWRWLKVNGHKLLL